MRFCFVLDFCEFDQWLMGKIFFFGAKRGRLMTWISNPRVIL